MHSTNPYWFWLIVFSFLRCKHRDWRGQPQAESCWWKQKINDGSDWTNCEKIFCFLRVDAWLDACFEQSPHRLVIRWHYARHGIIGDTLNDRTMQKTGEIAVTSYAKRVRFVFEQNAVRVGGRSLLARRVEFLRAWIVFVSRWKCYVCLFEVFECRPIG